MIFLKNLLLVIMFEFWTAEMSKTMLSTMKILVAKRNDIFKLVHFHKFVSKLSSNYLGIILSNQTLSFCFSKFRVFVLNFQNYPVLIITNLLKGMKRQHEIQIWSDWKLIESLKCIEWMNKLFRDRGSDFEWEFFIGCVSGFWEQLEKKCDECERNRRYERLPRIY